MTDLHRYALWPEFDARHFTVDPNGDWVKWADVSSRLQQLEQEKARLETELKELRARVAQTGVIHGPSVPQGGIG